MKKNRFLQIMLLLIACVLLFTGCNKEPDTPSGTPPPAPSIQEQPLPPEPTPGYDLPDPDTINPLTGEDRPSGMEPGQRPVAVMVANNTAALPQRGLAAADAVFELATEGGITRLMALYADSGSLPQVGPVRSTRDGFVELAVPVNAVLVHIGSSIYAEDILSALSFKGINGIQLGRTAFWFDDARNNQKSNEYCWFTDADLVSAGMETGSIASKGEVRSLFIFSDEEEVPAGDRAAKEVFLWFSGVSETTFRYEDGLYRKYLGEEPHADEDGAQLAFTNLFVLRCEIGKKPDGVSSDFRLTEGEGVYITNGRALDITWQKLGPDAQLEVYTMEGNPLRVARGRSYISFVNGESMDTVQIT